MTRIIEVTLYNYDELSETAKEKARDWYAEGVFGFDWWQFIYEDAENIGLVIKNFDDYRLEAKFSRYAEFTARRCFEDHGADCETHKDSVAFIKEFESRTEALNVGIEALQEADTEDWQDEATDLEDAFDAWLEGAESEYLYTMQENYRIILRREAEYLTSQESIEEGIRANEYEFYGDGKIA